MLERVHMILGKRYAYTIFMNNDLICSEWGPRYAFSFDKGGFAKITGEVLV